MWNTIMLWAANQVKQGLWCHIRHAPRFLQFAINIIPSPYSPPLSPYSPLVLLLSEISDFPLLKKHRIWESWPLFPPCFAPFENKGGIRARNYIDAVRAAVVRVAAVGRRLLRLVWILIPGFRVLCASLLSLETGAGNPKR